MTNSELMREAIALAERGRGYVEPNPMVGALIVRDGVVVGRGWHAKFGGPHAEVVALNEAVERARGATLYVTLEPCCHHGKTPPCTDAVIRAGISRVVIAMADPFPQVAGKGIQQLRDAGIQVEVGVHESDSTQLNRPYLTLMEKNRPYVHLKWAMTLDGRIATATGESQWISGEASRKVVHELRGRMDAVIVGAGTVRKDDPLLTARPPGARIASRVVLSRRPELPRGCRLIETAREAPVIVATGEPGEIPNVETLCLPSDSQGRPSIGALLTELGRRRFTNVLVEGGTEVFGSFLDTRFVDEVHVFVAPKLMGGHASSSAIGGLGHERIADMLTLSRFETQRLGDDIYIRGRR
ncbi:MAG: bifunctional diaminohydroxyphosphoribosylaminopyrimidine deaminase/5-amino-6-(5-phosphoribosylamino)uracil reductase RibD [Gemmataceae bacterium]